MKLKWIETNVIEKILVDNPISSNFTEELDSGTVLLLGKETRLKIEILDEVALLNDDNTVFKYFCIGDYEEKEVNPSNPHYDYTISLVSQTKKLESTILPNLSITKTSKNRSVWYYINNYLNLYGQKVRKNTPHGKLPDAYKEVEYIQSNGLQYIDTGVVPDKYTGIRVDYSEVILLPSYTRGIAGTRQIVDGSPIKSFGFGYETPETIEGVLKAARIAYYNNQSFVKTEYEFGEDTYGYETENSDKIYQYLEKNELTLGDATWSHVFYPPPFPYPQYQSDFTGYGSIYLFAFNETVIHPTALKLYGCKIFQNNIMVRNFVPCYRVSDGKIGLYDLIDRIFYTNAGSGEFTKPDTDVPYVVEPNWQLKWYFSPEVQNKFDKILCPEFQWNRPTLREVLNDLMMVGNCIPVLNNNEISFLDLGSRKNTKLLKEHINSIHRNKSLEDYATELEMELQNVIQDSADGVYNLTNIVEYMGFRNENEYALNTENVKIYTKNPIYDIKHLWLCVAIKINYIGFMNTRYQRYLLEIDLCDVEGLNFVKENKEYLTLELAYDTSDTDTLEDMNKYQNFNLSYNRGGREISGFFDETKKFWFINKSFLELLIQKAVDKIVNPQFAEFVLWNTISVVADEIWPYVSGKIDLRDISFKIEYQALSNTKFRAGKLLPYENERIVVDNQTNSYVNASKQGILEYLKANRLGNEILLINSRYDNLSSQGLVDVGSTYGEIIGYDYEDNPIYDNSYVIFKRQIQVNPNYINVIYYATKHYILKDYFTGVKAKIRSWKIESEESLIRNELHKYYYEFSFDNKLNSDELPVSENAMLSSFKTHYEDEIMKYSLIRSLIGYDNSNFVDPDVVFPENDYESYPIPRPPYSLNHLKYILTELNNKVMGNTIVFDTQMADNWGAGVRIKGKSSITGSFTSGDYPIEQEIRYVDNYGELREVYFTMTSDMNINKADADNWNFPELIPDNSIWFNKYYISGQEYFTALFGKKPLAQDYIIINENDAYNETFEVFKDQREVMALSLQLEYCSNNENIVFGNQLVKDNNLISTNYREDYNDIEGEFTISGNLIDIVIFSDISDVPSPTDAGQAAIVGSENDNVITYTYYLSEMETASYTLFTKDLLSEEDVISLGSQLDGEYVIGITYSYTYPVPSGSAYKNIVSIERPSFPSEMPSATDYNNKYIIAWVYAARTLSTMTIDWDFFVNDVVAPVNSYRIVKHADNVSTIIVGELAYDSSWGKPAFTDYGPTSTKPSASGNQGKYIIVSTLTPLYFKLMVSTYNQSTQQWEWVQATDSNNRPIYMNQSSDIPSGAVSYYGSHYSFYYSGDTQPLIYYWSGGYMPPYYRFTGVNLNNQTFKYYLQRRRTSDWFTVNSNYTNDTTNVYAYNNTYYQWINSAWTTNISSSASKAHNWYHAVNGEWQYDSAASAGDYGYLGNTTDSLDTEWYSFSSSNTWSFLGNTTREPSSYKLYTYSGGSINDVSNLLSGNLFFYENKNYQWNVTEPTTNAGNWVDNTNYVWYNQGSPNNKYFKFEGNVYQFADDNLVFQQTLIPKRNINRTDLRLFKSLENKVRIYDMNYLPDELDRVEITNWDFSIGSNYIELTGLSGDMFSYYLTDSNLNVLLAFNAPARMGLSVRIYLNGYKSRNKKIYNS